MLKQVVKSTSSIITNLSESRLSRRSFLGMISNIFGASLISDTSSVDPSKLFASPESVPWMSAMVKLATKHSQISAAFITAAKTIEAAKTARSSFDYDMKIASAIRWGLRADAVFDFSDIGLYQSLAGIFSPQHRKYGSFFNHPEFEKLISDPSFRSVIADKKREAWLKICTEDSESWQKLLKTESRLVANSILNAVEYGPTAANKLPALLTKHKNSSGSLAFKYLQIFNNPALVTDLAEDPVFNALADLKHVLFASFESGTQAEILKSSIAPEIRYQLIESLETLDKHNIKIPAYLKTRLDLIKRSSYIAYDNPLQELDDTGIPLNLQLLLNNLDLSSWRATASHGRQKVSCTGYLDNDKKVFFRLEAKSNSSNRWKLDLRRRNTSMK